MTSSAKHMLIEKTHPEETRVVIIDNKKLVDFDSETNTKKLWKGNIFLVEVMQVVASLQAAFVRYKDDKNDRYGFLAFHDIHPRYYQIPSQDQSEVSDPSSWEALDEERPPEDEAPAAEPPSKKKYRIQDVIKRRQIMTAQIIRDERGLKGAAMTTYVALPGRYCVLMPNTPKKIGISKKIAQPQDRQKLKALMESLPRPDNMTFIVRTAGIGRTKAEIKRDLDYLLRLWEDIQKKIETEQAPSLIYEEANLITRSLRDHYQRDMESVIIEGEEAYQQARDFMKMLIPSHARKIKLHKDGQPLFQLYKVEEALESIHQPHVPLPSGGHLVIHATEALIAIDVNSGKSSKERHIEDTAFKTNLEAADEIVRQVHLRDLGGLIVIDFIDMDQKKHRLSVEKQLKDRFASDRSRVHVGRIDEFGLLSLSRQRLRPSLQESYTVTCPQCQGLGVIRSVESASLVALRVMDQYRQAVSLVLAVSPSVGMYLLNQKREVLHQKERAYDLSITIQLDDSLSPPNVRVVEPLTPPEPASPRKNKRRRSQRKENKELAAPLETSAQDTEPKKPTQQQQQQQQQQAEPAISPEDPQPEPKKKKRLKKPLMDEGWEKPETPKRRWWKKILN